MYRHLRTKLHTTSRIFSPLPGNRRPLTVSAGSTMARVSALSWSLGETTPFGWLWASTRPTAARCRAVPHKSVPGVQVAHLEDLGRQRADTHPPEAGKPV